MNGSNLPISRREFVRLATSASVAAGWAASGFSSAQASSPAKTQIKAVLFNVFVVFDPRKISSHPLTCGLLGFTRNSVLTRHFDGNKRGRRMYLMRDAGFSPRLLGISTQRHLKTATAKRKTRCSRSLPDAFISAGLALPNLVRLLSS